MQTVRAFAGCNCNIYFFMPTRPPYPNVICVSMIAFSHYMCTLTLIKSSMYWILVFGEGKRINDTKFPDLSEILDREIMGMIYNGDANHVSKKRRHLLGRGFVGIEVVKSRTM